MHEPITWQFGDHQPAVVFFDGRTAYRVDQPVDKLKRVPIMQAADRRTMRIAKALMEEAMDLLGETIEANRDFS